jgi:hypothetical protein
MHKLLFVFLAALLISLVGCNSTPPSTPLLVDGNTTALTSQPPLDVFAGATANLEQEVGKQEEIVETPTSTPKPTSTPEPGLRTTGPYFSYFRNVDARYQLVLMDADGKGRKTVSLPDDLEGNLLPNGKTNYQISFVSPDGKWMVFYTGFAGSLWQGAQTDEGPYDFALNLLELATGKTQLITPLLSKDYPENFKQAEKQINNPYITAFALQTAFLNGITESIAWSPDSRYLAFAGQMDGMSSDLYVYDIQSNSIRRLSSGDQELQWINWSPDGKWILHGAAYETGMGMIYDKYAADVSGTSVRQLSQASSYVVTWVNSHTYLEHDNENVYGSYGLRLVDINTGAIKKIWDGSFISYCLDRNSNWLALTTLTPDVHPTDREFTDNTISQPGLYLVNLSTLKKNMVEFQTDNIYLHYFVFPFGIDGQLFFLTSEGSGSYFLSEELNLSPLDLKSANVLVSPDLNYWAALTDKSVEVYSSGNVVVLSTSISLSINGNSDLMWSPDSTRLILIDNTIIFSIEVPSGEIEEIETQMTNDLFDRSYMWIGISE